MHWVGRTLAHPNGELSKDRVLQRFMVLLSIQRSSVLFGILYHLINKMVI